MMITKSTALIIPLLTLLSLTATARISDEEIELAIRTLRAHGYTLFPNAIATSDLRILFLSSSANSNFTLFSPPDPLLYSLDLSSPADYYVHSLLRHVSPTRLPISLLRSLPYVNTLVPTKRLVIADSKNGTVWVDGVRVSEPDLFVGSGFVVHGLEGILVNEFENGVESGAPASAPAPWAAWEEVRRDSRKKKKHRRRHHGGHVENQEHGNFHEWSHA